MKFFPARRAVAGSLVAAAALVVTAIVGPAAQAAFPGYTLFVRPADFVDPTGTRGDATMQVQSDGVHLHVGDPSGLVAASFDVPGGLPFGDFNLYGYHVAYDWTGTTDEPGIHYDLDLDGDGSVDLELVGEHLYGDDMWLNPDRPANSSVPWRIVRAAAPCRGDHPQRSLRNGCGATYGSVYHGDILDWISAFSDAGYADGSVLKGGFVATGGHIDGVLADLHIGIATFRFTTDPPVPADVTIAVSPKKVAFGATVDVSGSAANTFNYPHVIVQEKDPGQDWRTVGEQTLTRGDHYDVAVVPAAVGVVKYRTEVPASSYNTATFTKPVAVRVS